MPAPTVKTTIVKPTTPVGETKIARLFGEFAHEYIFGTIKSWQFDMFYRMLLERTKHLPEDDVRILLEWTQAEIVKAQKHLRKHSLVFTKKYQAVLRIQRREMENGTATPEMYDELDAANKQAKLALENIQGETAEGQ